MLIRQLLAGEGEHALLSAASEEASLPVTLTYQEKKLIQLQKKSAGKNQSNWDGFYQDEKGKEYFIKVPQDKRELFTELFAGKILTKLKNASLMDAKYHDLLICADVIKLPDGSYGLIQPKKKFTEIWKYFSEREKSQNANRLTAMLWKKITDTLSSTGDRNVIDEMVFGRFHYYPLLTELGALDSLAAVILYSMIIGDYSVHSANVVYFEKEKSTEAPIDSFESIERTTVEFSRIDWGAAWRNYGKPQNQDVMNPMEYHGYKGYTKGYHHFYTQIPGLFKAVSDQAKNLQEKFNLDFLVTLITNAINEIPTDLLTKEERANTAEYIGFNTFNEASINNPKAIKIFAQDLANIMFNRISSLAKLAPSSMQQAQQNQVPNLPLPKKLASNEMFDLAFTKINKAGHEYGVKVDILQPSPYESGVYGARFISNEQNVILTSAASDTQSIDGRNAGTTPLAQVLKRIRSLQKENTHETYLVPLAECQYVLMGLTYRQHWTVLMIQGNECYFFDPMASVSYFYSLYYLKNILREEGFDLKKENISYLGWQNDNVNCGRFCAAIAEKAAEMLFSKKDLDIVKRSLQALPHPLVKNLVSESVYCMADRRIISSQAICVARNHELLKNKLSRKSLLRLSKSGFSKNAYLAEVAVKEFFEEDAASVSISHAYNEVSYSQGPLMFLPFVLNDGIVKKDLVLRPLSDENFRVDVINKKGKIQLICEYLSFPLVLAENNEIVGHMEGPVTVSYERIEKAGKFGWQLKYVTTNNTDILKILNGNLLPEQALIDHYCVLPQVKTYQVAPVTFVVENFYSLEKEALQIPSASPETIIVLYDANCSNLFSYQVGDTVRRITCKTEEDKEVDNKLNEEHFSTLKTMFEQYDNQTLNIDNLNQKERAAYNAMLDVISKNTQTPSANLSLLLQSKKAALSPDKTPSAMSSNEEKLTATSNELELKNKKIAELQTQNQKLLLQIRAQTANVVMLKQKKIHATNKQVTQTIIPTPKKTAWWKYVLAGACTIVGVVLAATGVLSLPGIALLSVGISQSLAIGFAAGGAVISISSAAYAGKLQRSDNQAQKKYEVAVDAAKSHIINISAYSPSSSPLSSHEKASPATSPSLGLFTHPRDHDAILNKDQEIEFQPPSIR